MKPLMHRVVEAVIRDGRHTTETLRAVLPDAAEASIRVALWNASYKGLVQAVDSSECGGVRRGHTWYGPTGKAPKPAREGLLRLVADLVINSEGVTTDDIMERFPGHTRSKVVDALENAKQARLIESLPGKPGRSKRGVPCAVFYAVGRKPTDSLIELDEDELFKPNAKRQARTAYASVFHYGQGVGVTLTASNESSARRTA